MNILLVAATPAEIAPLADLLQQQWHQQPDGWLSNGTHHLQILISGVGLLPTTYHLTKKLVNHSFDLVLQAGIAGSYDRSLELASLAFISTETLGDTGAEDQYNFLDIFDLGLTPPDEAPFRSKTLPNPHGPSSLGISLPQVSALTVNMTAGTSFQAERRWRKYGCQLESMEGAALHYVCLLQNIPFAQVRSISNYVEARDRSRWKIPEAISSLNNWLSSYLLHIN